MPKHQRYAVLSVNNHELRQCHVVCHSCIPFTGIHRLLHHLINEQYIVLINRVILCLSTIFSIVSYTFITKTTMKDINSI
jgi:hypothetical protein